MCYNSVIQQEYDKISKKEKVTKNGKKFIVNLYDFTRKTIIGNYDNYSGDINAVNFIASNKVNTFLL
jgi:hypothetical protein